MITLLRRPPLARAAPATLGACAIFAAGMAVGIAIGPIAGRSSEVGRSQPSPRQALPPAAPAAFRGGHSAEVLRVNDGDTFEARVRVWPGIEINTKVRLRGIDAPELNARCSEEYAKAGAARDTLAALLRDGDISIFDVGLDKYGGRVVARVATRRTPDVSKALSDAGLARPYDGGRRESWCG